MQDFLIILAVLAIVALWYVFFGRRANVVIRDPVIGFLNLAGEEGAPLLQEDRSVLGHHFSRIEESERELPRCDVLFLYCRISDFGLIEGASDPLRGLIARSGCKVAVVAMNNQSDCYVAALKPGGPKTANIVMTLDRQGQCFTSFFDQLFKKMKNGTSMPVAWNELAPQYPGADHTSVPATMGLIEAGGVGFR